MDEDARLRERYRPVMAEPATAHPDDGLWEQMAMGELAPAAREAFFDHVCRCATCADIYRGLQSLATEARAFDPGVPKVQGRILPWKSPWLYAGLAAAAVVILAVRLPSTSPTPPTPDTVRSLPLPAPQPLTPVGRVATPPAELRWKPIAEVTRYRVDLVDAAGNRLWRSPEVDAVSVPWPASVPPAPGTYFWQVTAVPSAEQPLSTEVTSELVSFQILRSPSR